MTIFYFINWNIAVKSIQGWKLFNRDFFLWKFGNHISTLTNIKQAFMLLAAEIKNRERWQFFDEKSPTINLDALPRSRSRCCTERTRSEGSNSSNGGIWTHDHLIRSLILYLQNRYANSCWNMLKGCVILSQMVNKCKDQLFVSHSFTTGYLIAKWVK